MNISDGYRDLHSPRTSPVRGYAVVPPSKITVMGNLGLLFVCIYLPMQAILSLNLLSN